MTLNVDSLRLERVERLPDHDGSFIIEFRTKDVQQRDLPKAHVPQPDLLEGAPNRWVQYPPRRSPSHNGGFSFDSERTFELSILPAAARVRLEPRWSCPMTKVRIEHIDNSATRDDIDAILARDGCLVMRNAVDHAAIDALLG
ncbi:MAG: hypothetical protein CMM46_14935 [Rhodospirillaceae bacterium]|nr:hypothetical protein [Rhodospirillaceae bacterium]